MNLATLIARIRTAPLAEAEDALARAEHYMHSKKAGEGHSVPVYIRRGDAALGRIVALSRASEFDFALALPASNGSTAFDAASYDAPHAPFSWSRSRRVRGWAACRIEAMEPFSICFLRLTRER